MAGSILLLLPFLAVNIICVEFVPVEPVDLFTDLTKAEDRTFLKNVYPKIVEHLEQDIKVTYHFVGNEYSTFMGCNLQAVSLKDQAKILKCVAKLNAITSSGLTKCYTKVAGDVKNDCKLTKDVAYNYEYDTSVTPYLLVGGTKYFSHWDTFLEDLSADNEVPEFSSTNAKLRQNHHITLDPQETDSDWDKFFENRVFRDYTRTNSKLGNEYDRTVPDSELPEENPLNLESQSSNPWYGPEPEPIPNPWDHHEPKPIPNPWYRPEPEPIPNPWDHHEPKPIPNPWYRPEPEPIPDPWDHHEPEPIPNPWYHPEPIPNPWYHPEPIPNPWYRPDPQPIPNPWYRPDSETIYVPVPVPRDVKIPFVVPVPVPVLIESSNPVPVPIPPPTPYPYNEKPNSDYFSKSEPIEDYSNRQSQSESYYPQPDPVYPPGPHPDPYYPPGPQPGPIPIPIPPPGPIPPSIVYYPVPYDVPIPVPIFEELLFPVPVGDNSIPIPIPGPYNTEYPKTTYKSEENYPEYPKNSQESEKYDPKDSYESQDHYPVYVPKNKYESEDHYPEYPKSPYDGDEHYFEKEEQYPEYPNFVLEPFWRNEEPKNRRPRFPPSRRSDDLEYPRPQLPDIDGENDFDRKLSFTEEASADKPILSMPADDSSVKLRSNMDIIFYPPGIYPEDRDKKDEKSRAKRDAEPAEIEYVALEGLDNEGKRNILEGPKESSVVKNVKTKQQKKVLIYETDCC